MYKSASFITFLSLPVGLPGRIHQHNVLRLEIGMDQPQLFQFQQGCQHLKKILFNFGPYCFSFSRLSAPVKFNICIDCSLFKASSIARSNFKPWASVTESLFHLFVSTVEIYLWIGKIRIIIGQWSLVSLKKKKIILFASMYWCKYANYSRW